MKCGYARVSTEDQNPAMQFAALEKAGCKTVFKYEVIRADQKMTATWVRSCQVAPNSGRNAL
jgi:DNA invertase Pin-like site-specific DNA recombinase